MMLDDFKLNDRGERTDQCDPTTVLNYDYWDCECEDNGEMGYIHPITEPECSRCGTIQHDGPSSRANEVDGEITAGRLHPIDLGVRDAFLREQDQ